LGDPAFDYNKPQTQHERTTTYEAITQ